MQFLNQCERKFGWLSFPGFLRYYAIFHVLVYLLQFVNPQIGIFLEFDRSKILAGEVWRLVTFLFASSGLGGQDAFGMLFLFFMVMIAFMISDALEGAWGLFRTSMFYYTGYLGLIIANFLYDTPMVGSGMLIYSAAFFAFATLFPKVEFLLMFIIPVQIRWLALLGTIYYAIEIYRSPLLIGFYLLGFVNYLLWAAIPALRGQGLLVKAARRRKSFEKNTATDENTFHRCVVCSNTELSHPDLEFRMATDGKEYCTDHLKN